MNKDSDTLHRTQYDSSTNLKKRMALFQESSGTNLWRSVSDAYNFAAESQVLEIGGGNGEFWVENSERLPSKLRVIFTDRSQGMVEEARKRITHPGFLFQTEDACQLSFSDDCFDWVISHFMLYHLPDPEQAFREVRRVLRRNGAFGIVLPKRNKDPVPEYLLFALSLVPEARDEFERTSTAQFFSGDAEALLREYFDTVVTSSIPSTIILSDAELVFESILSLPVFQSDVVGNGFRERLQEAFYPWFKDHGPLTQENVVEILIGKDQPA